MEISLSMVLRAHKAHVHRSHRERTSLPGSSSTLMSDGAATASAVLLLLRPVATSGAATGAGAGAGMSGMGSGTASTGLSTGSWTVSEVISLILDSCNGH